MTLIFRGDGGKLSCAGLAVLRLPRIEDLLNLKREAARQLLILQRPDVCGILEFTIFCRSELLASF